MESVCTVNDAECVGGRLKRGLCEKHYRRQRTTGSTASPFIDNWSRFTVVGECWIWSGPLYRNGYGEMSRRFLGTGLAHRAFYMRKNGVLDRSVDLDHLCRDRRCVNPNHLQPVTRRANLRRGAGSHDGVKTACRKRLHDTTLPGALRTNANGSRECVECWRTRYRAAGARYRAKLRGH